ncbi:MAG: hypothetical protein ACR2RV_06025, partial [Verrucomicrobiales bacterium]
MSESASPSCQRCGSALPAAAPGDLCPACVMGGALESVDSPRSDGELGTTADLNLEGLRPAPWGVGDPLEGTTLGLADRYKILQRIGEGGFGTVYMAEQSKPVRRRVALKILKAGMDTRQVVARFEA